jgi:hypothetical protein
LSRGQLCTSIPGRPIPSSNRFVSKLSGVIDANQGETEQRLFAVPVWRETPFFSPRERAALAWTEAVTDIGRSGVSDALYDEARPQFTDKELVDLTVAVIAINAWNRLAVTFRPAVGNYKPAAATTAASA